MAVSAEWVKAQRKLCDKWRDLAEMPIEEDPTTFLNALKAPCAFREQAQADIESLGLPKEGVTLYPVDFCHGCLDLGGCDPVVTRVETLLEKRYYVAARREVRDYLRKLERLELPDVGD